MDPMAHRTGLRLKRNEGVTVGTTAILVGILITLSRLTGIIRDTGRTTLFGRNWQTDAYVSAFSIPDLIYFLASGGALSAGFIPVFSGFLAKGEDEKAVKTFQVLLTYLGLLLILLIVCFEIAAPSLVSLLFPGMREQPERLQLTTTLARILLPAQFFFVLGSLFSGALFSLRYFAEPQVQSILYNLLILLGGIGGSVWGKEWTGGGVEGMAIGAVTGAMVGAGLVQSRKLRQLGVPLSLNFDWKDPGAREVLRLVIPVVFSLSVTQITAIILPRSFSSFLEEGSATAVEMANRVMQLPVALFGASVGIAVFPILSEDAALDRRHQLKGSLTSALRAVLILTVITAVLMAILREPIVSVLFQYGRWLQHDTEETAWALLFYSLGVPAMASQQILARGFYALRETWTPVWVGAITLVLAWVLNFLFVHTPLQQGGLSLAFSLSSWFNSSLLFLLLSRRLGGLETLRLPALGGSLLLAATLSAAVAHGALLILPSFDGVSRPIRLLLPGLVSVLVYVAILSRCPLPEVRNFAVSLITKGKRRLL